MSHAAVELEHDRDTESVVATTTVESEVPGPTAPVALTISPEKEGFKKAMPRTRDRGLAVAGERRSRGAADLLNPPVADEVAPTVEPERILSEDEKIAARVARAEGLAWEGGTATLSSDGGFGGVAFFTVNGSSYVVKPLTGSMASPLFAEYVLGEVAGVQHTETAPLPSSSPAFVKIKARLKELSGGEDEKFKKRWSEVAKFYDSATHFLVQTSMKDESFKGSGGEQSHTGSEVKHQDRISLLNNRAALKQLGATLVADSLLGNADRLQQVNGGNFFVLGTGMIGAIDNEAFFPAEKALLDHLDEVEAQSEVYMKSLDIADRPTAEANGLVREQNKGLDDHERWAAFVLGNIKGGGVKFDGTPNHTAKVETFDSWFVLNFVSEWMQAAGLARQDTPEMKTQKQADLDQVDKVRAVYGNPPTKVADVAGLDPEGWGRVRADLLAGYEEGFAKLAANMPAIRQRFTELTSASPDASGTMDQDAFDLRASYMAGMAEGMAKLDAPGKKDFYGTTVAAEKQDPSSLRESNPTRSARESAAKVDATKQAAVRERALAEFATKEPAKTHPKVERVLETAVGISARERALARILLGELNPAEIEPLLHIRTNAALGRKLGSGQGEEMEKAWDGVRGRLLQALVGDVLSGYQTVADLTIKGTAAYAKGKARAAAALKALNHTLKTTTKEELTGYKLAP